MEKLIFVASNSYRARISNSHKYKYLNCVQLPGHFPTSKSDLEREENFLIYFTFFFLWKYCFSSIGNVAQLWKILSSFNFHFEERCFMYPEGFKSFRRFFFVFLLKFLKGGGDIILKKSKAHDQNTEKDVKHELKRIFFSSVY